MRYIITGASGHIGNNLVRYINEIEPNSEIICLVRRNITKELEGTNAKQIIGNICDQTFLSQNIKKGDIVIHCAGLIDLTNKEKEQMYNINYVSVKEISQACIDNKAKRLVYIGSVDGIYRTGDEKEIVEPREYFPDKMQDYYGYTKALAMQHIHDLIKENKNISMIIPSAVIGINDYKPSAIGKVILSCIKGKAEFGLNGGYNFVDVLDITKSIYTASHSKNVGEYIISGWNLTIKEFYAKINTFLGLKKKPIIIPDFMLKTCMPFVKVLNKVTIKALKDIHDYSSLKASKELNYSPIDINDTIKNTVDWFNFNIDKF